MGVRPKDPRDEFEKAKKKVDDMQPQMKELRKGVVTDIAVAFNPIPTCAQGVAIGLIPGASKVKSWIELAQSLEERGKVAKVYDQARCDMAQKDFAQGDSKSSYGVISIGGAHYRLEQCPGRPEGCLVPHPRSKIDEVKKVGREIKDAVISLLPWN